MVNEEQDNKNKDNNKINENLLNKTTSNLKNTEINENNNEIVSNEEKISNLNNSESNSQQSEDNNEDNNEDNINKSLDDKQSKKFELDESNDSDDTILSPEDLENVSDPSQIENAESEITKVLEDSGWQPKTEIGKKVKSGEITNIDEILDNGYPILEPEIVDKLLPNLKTEILFIGQAKGKFGGGQRRPVRQTQKKTEEGNKPRFTIIAAVGNEDGYVGIGVGKAKETVPAREKAIRKAKLNIIKIRRGCGSWECNCGNPHSIPLAIEGKTGSVKIKLLPAPKGKGLIIEEELKKIMRLAGIRDLWSVTKGQTGTKFNLIFACFDALNNLNKFKIKSNYANYVGLTEGSMINKEIEESQEIKESLD